MIRRISIFAVIFAMTVGSTATATESEKKSKTQERERPSGEREHRDPEQRERGSDKVFRDRMDEHLDRCTKNPDAVGCRDQVSADPCKINPGLPACTQGS